MSLFIVLGLLVLALIGWLLLKGRGAADGTPGHDVSAAARKARGHAEGFGGGTRGGDGMNG